MKSFPTNLKPENKEKFSVYKYNRILCYLRKEITELILEGDENNYFEIDKFQKLYMLKNDEVKRMIENVSKDLETLGWKVKTSFAGTGLFVYSTPDPPPSCHDDIF